jgi:copper(I)-binding protein
VDAGQTLEFAPNGMHVMLIGLKKPLVEWQKFELALQFEVAGPRKVKVEVRKP